MKRVRRDPLVGKIKYECHKLMDLIWPGSKAEAYIWLYRNTGLRHIADIDEYRQAFEVRRKMMELADKEGIL